jgi:hypothetical protein
MVNNLKDYRARIIDRAYILKLELEEPELESLNRLVNDRVNKGTHPFDALDMIYFHLQDKYKK